MADELWQVKQNTGQNEGRVLFKGLEEDARTYVENNFPRPHIESFGGEEEPKMDVHLISPDGVAEHFLGEGNKDPWQFVEKPTKTTKSTTRGGTQNA